MRGPVFSLRGIQNLGKRSGPLIGLLSLWKKKKKKTHKKKNKPTSGLRLFSSELHKSGSNIYLILRTISFPVSINKIKM